MSIDETEFITEINRCIDRKEKWYLRRIKSLEKQKSQVEHLKEQKQQAIALIKDGRFIEALQLLEGK